MAELVPFKEGALTTPLTPLENVRLRGIKCRTCGALSMGERKYCINCTSPDIEEHIFSKYGKVYSCTIIRHAPPPPYPQETFQPFPAAWVELEDGLQIITELADCGLEEAEIDMPVEMIATKGWEDADGNDVIMYKFRPRK
jgi:uncharacterized OB-fold protein